MYKLFMLNFGYFLDYVFETLEEAKEKAKDVGFEIVIYKDGEIVTTIKNY